MSEVGDLYVILRAVTEPFRASMREAAAEGEASSGRISGAFGRLSRIGIGVGAAAATIAGVTVKMAGDFQAEMAKLTTQAGVAKDKMGELSNGVLNLAGQVGFSPTSLAESLFHVESNFESLGISAPKALELVKIAAEGAATGHADLVDVTNALTAAVASGIPGVQNFSQAMGVLNGIVGVGDMQMQDLANAFGSGMVATVKGFGLTIRDVGAALAVFGDNNIRGSLAGNQLRMSVMALAMPVKSAGYWLEKFGMTGQTLADDMKKGGLKLALEDLQGRFKKAGITAKDQGDVITQMFGRKAGAGLNVLMDQMDRLESKYPALDKAASGFGDSWAGTQKTFNQQLKETEQGLIAMGIKLGTVLLPYVQKFLGWVRVGVNWLTQHKSAVMVLAGALGVTLVAAIVAVGGALVAAIGWAEVIAVAIMAIGAGAVYAYQRFKTFRTIVQDIAAVTKTVFVDAIKGARIAIQALVTWWEQHKAQFAAAWSAVFKAVQALVKWFNDNVLAWVKARISDLVDWWHAHSAEIAAVWRFTWILIRTIAKATWDGYIHPLLKLIENTWKTTWIVIRDGTKLIWSVISSYITMVMHNVLNIISLILDIITGRWSRVWGDLKRLVGQAISGVVRVLLNATSGFGTLLWDAGRSVIHGFVGGIKSAFGSVKSALGDLTSMIPNLKGPPARDALLLRPNGRLVISGFLDGIADQVPAVRATLGDLTRGLPGMVRGVPGVGALAVGGIGGYGAGGLPDIVVNVDGRQLFKIMQRQTLRNNKRNPTNGLSLT
ncbi:MAG: phage tail tape measure protein [Catenulispora sp.]|nr:phage tail tape measure protein [Catenulispora sp.]